MYRRSRQLPNIHESTKSFRANTTTTIHYFTYQRACDTYRPLHATTQAPALDMDYETPDGSQFSLQEVFTDGDGDGNNSPAFQYTSITALVNGEAFAGKSDQRMEDVDEIDILDLLRPVPLENINPLVPDDFTRAPPLSHDAHFLKAPSFMYEDIEPGRTFVAACLLNEATDHHHHHHKSSLGTSPFSAKLDLISRFLRFPPNILFYIAIAFTSQRSTL